VQYHGGNALGFSYQGPKGENCIVYEPRSNDSIIQADLRGLESIEGRIRRALNCLVGSENYQNIQVSSRTDRGVHAWRNTFQVDIRSRLSKNTDESEMSAAKYGRESRLERWNCRDLVHGLNFYLSRLPSLLPEPQHNDPTVTSTIGQRLDAPGLCNNTIRILSAGVAPKTRIPNHNYDPNLPQDADNPIDLPWDVRFTATRRTYAYRILHSFDHESGINSSNDLYSTACYHSYPFEDDRVWRIHEKRPTKFSKKWNSNQTSPSSLNIDAMNLAGSYLIGTHDFTSFRGKGCQRASPIVTVEDICCYSENYHGQFGEGILNAAFKRQPSCYAYAPPITPDTLKLVTVVISGKSFVYHQIRNMVACLVEVGQGKMTPDDLKVILEKMDRSCAVGMAPPQGLFLLDVEHGDFRF
jgi:tRNA pseudouridine38-40 synthase